ncbi:MAG: DUF4304 domain-containing protein [Candidatus Methylophosphatis roskildensis]
MNAAKPPNTRKLFGQIAKELGFQGSGVTRYIEFPTYYLLVNHQGSVYGKCFYVNVAIYYKELLDKPLEDKDITDTFKVHSAVWPHVTFRIEGCPTVPADLQEHFDHLVKVDRMDDLKEILRDALQKMLAFMRENHDRKTIRRLNDAKQFPAMLLKEV